MIFQPGNGIISGEFIGNSRFGPEVRPQPQQQQAQLNCNCKRCVRFNYLNNRLKNPAEYVLKWITNSNNKEFICVENKITKQNVLIKSYRLSNTNSEEAFKEFEIGQLIYNNKDKSPFVVEFVNFLLNFSFPYNQIDCIAMKYVEGQDLFRIAKKFKTKVANPQIWKFLGSCIYLALDYFHNVIHLIYSDLKPENIVIDQYGYPVIVDFNICGQMPYFKKLQGTLQYMAPECWSSDFFTEKIDYWGLGVLGFFLNFNLMPPWCNLITDPIGLKGKKNNYDRIELSMNDKDFISLVNTNPLVKGVRD